MRGRASPSSFEARKSSHLRMTAIILPRCLAGPRSREDDNEYAVMSGGGNSSAGCAGREQAQNRQLGRSDSARATSKNDQNYFFFDFLAFLTVFFAFFAFLAFFAITSLIGFELTSTSRGVLGDRPVRSLDSNPNRFVEICRLFFNVVPKS